MADEKDDVTLDTQNLDALIKALKGELSHVQIGILGAKGLTKHKDSEGNPTESNNATVGAAHEFGTSRLPKRSFLREPLADNLEKEMINSNAFSPEVLKQIVKEKSIIPWLKLVAVLAEKVVQEAFDSGGFGKWKPSNMAHKKVQQTLVETQQLRDSISTRIAK